MGEKLKGDTVRRSLARNWHYKWHWQWHQELTGAAGRPPRLQAPAYLRGDLARHPPLPVMDPNRVRDRKVLGVLLNVGSCFHKCYRLSLTACEKPTL